MVLVVPGNIRNGSLASFPKIARDHAGVYQYGLCIRADWGLTLFQRVIDADPRDPGSYDWVDLSADATAAAGLNLPINSFDDHWSCGLVPDAEDRLHVLGNSHAHILHEGAAGETNGQHYIYSDGNWPPTWTASTWSARPWASTGVNSHTYNILNRLPNGTSLLFMDQQEIVDFSRGRDWLGYYKLAGASATGWLPILGSTGEFARTVATNPQGVNADRVYLTDVVVDPGAAPDGSDWIYVVGYWRLWDWQSASSIDPFLIRGRSSALGTAAGWEAIDGTPITMPITWAQRAAARIGAATAWGAASGLAIVNGAPHISIENGTTTGAGFGGGTLTSIVDENGATVSLVGAGGAIDLYFRGYWDGTQWQRARYAGIGSSNPPRLFRVHDTTFMATAAADRVRLRNRAGGVTGRASWIGGPVDSSGGGETFDPVHDPMALAQDGRLDLLITDGDDGRVLSLGGARAAVGLAVV